LTSRSIGPGGALERGTRGVRLYDLRKKST